MSKDIYSSDIESGWFRRKLFTGNYIWQSCLV